MSILCIRTSAKCFRLSHLRKSFSQHMDIGFLRNNRCDHGGNVLGAHELFVGGKACGMVRRMSQVEVGVKCLGKSSGTLKMVCGGPGRRGRKRRDPNSSHEWGGSQDCGVDGGEAWPNSGSNLRPSHSVMADEVWLEVAV